MTHHIYGGVNRKVAVIMGSKSDYPKLEDGIKLLERFGVEVSVRALSAHRTPKQLVSFLEEIENDTDVIIGAAGKAAHLGGVIAANTTLPVIGVPVKSSLEGMDALLSTVQMPPGIPVATVGIDGAVNAAILAAEILAVSDEKLAQLLLEKRLEAKEAVLEKNRRVEEKLNGGKNE